MLYSYERVHSIDCHSDSIDNICCYIFNVQTCRVVTSVVWDLRHLFPKMTSKQCVNGVDTGLYAMRADRCTFHLNLT